MHSRENPLQKALRWRCSDVRSSINWFAKLKKPICGTVRKVSQSLRTLFWKHTILNSCKAFTKEPWLFASIFGPDAITEFSNDHRPQFCWTINFDLLSYISYRRRCYRRDLPVISAGTHWLAKKPFRVTTVYRKSIFWSLSWSPSLIFKFDSFKETDKKNERL